jgi:anti-sigma regulatory factor (Ser/Thr protein kinase)
VSRSAQGEHIAWYLDFSFEAAPAARRAIRPYLLEWELTPEAVDSVFLLVTELVANSVEHGEPPLFLHLLHTDQHVTIVVHDAGNVTVAPSVEQAEPAAESGRGLYLIKALADDFVLASSEDGGTLAAARVSNRRPGCE